MTDLVHSEQSIGTEVKRCRHRFYRNLNTLNTCYCLPTMRLHFCFSSSFGKLLFSVCRSWRKFLVLVPRGVCSEYSHLSSQCAGLTKRQRLNQHILQNSRICTRKKKLFFIGVAKLEMYAECCWQPFKNRYSEQSHQDLASGTRFKPGSILLAVLFSQLPVGLIRRGYCSFI